MRQRTNLALVIFGLFAVILGSCRNQDIYIDPVDTQAFHQWMESSRTSPGQVLREKIREGRTPVLRQDTVFRADYAHLAAALLPTLYELGIEEIVVFFLDSKDQEKVDSFLNGTGDESVALDLLRGANPLMGYSEYRDFIMDVHDFNSLLRSGEKPLRLRALNNLEFVEDEAPLAMPKQFIWLLGPGEDFIGGSYLSIALYEPAVGALDLLLKERPLRDRSLGISTDEKPFSEFDFIDRRSDILIILPFPHKSVTPIKNFISEENAEGDSSPGQTNRQIVRMARRYARTIRKKSRSSPEHIETLKP